MIRFAGKIAPYWQTRPALAHYPRLGRDLTVDVAVVGGGITGLTAAWLLKKAGRSVAVLEMGEIGGGATGRTSGHLTAVLDRPFSSLVSSFGEEPVRTAVRTSLEAIDLVESIAGTFDREVGFERVPGFRFTEEDGKEGEIEREAEIATRLGLPTRIVNGIPAPFPVRAATRVADQAQFHPLQYLESLAEKVAGDGSFVFEHSRVEEIESGEPCRVRTSSHSVQAVSVIEATHTPINLSLGIQSRVGPYMSYVLALKLAVPPPPALLWDVSHPYHYLRRVRSESGDLLLVGGEDHKTGQDSDPVARLDALLEFARARFPVESVEWSWSHQVFEPADGLPYIGHKPGEKHVLVAGGFSGTGLTFGTAAGRLLAQQAQGIEPPEAAVFSPGRIKPLATAGKFLRENLNAAWHLVADRLRRYPEEGMPPLRPGEGRIVDLDGHRVGVYMDETSRLQVLSPVCTHAGGIVQWNDLEKTWDCPLHGGRYLPSGKVLCSPPTQDLEKPPDPAIPAPTAVGP